MGLARPWEPLTIGAVRDQCLDWTEAIGRALRDTACQAANAWEASTGTGLSGVALFFLYRHRAFGHEEDLDLALDYLAAAAEAASGDFESPSLLCGLPGIGWAIEHARRMLGEEGDDPLEDVDEAVERMARNLAASRGETDLFNGLTGLGVYALERLPRPRARSILERVVEGLYQQAIEEPGGLLWVRPERSDDDDPVLTVNLGTAHGLPGPIAILGAAASLGLLPGRVERWLEAAVDALLARRQGAGAIWRFSAVQRPGDPPRASRPTWCYGDPGVAAVLQSIAELTGRTDWSDAAVETARLAAARRAGDSGLTGPTFCHGGAGTALLFARLHHATGDGSTADAAAYWCRRLLAWRREGEGVGGVLSDPPPDGFDNWKNDRSLLTGAAGVGLSLLALATPVEPEWDRFFLCSPIPFTVWRVSPPLKAH